MGVISALRPIVERFPMLASFYRFTRDSKRLGSEVKYRERLGFSFNGSPSMQEGDFEPDETRIFERVIEYCDVFINVGANAGYYVCKALKHNKQTIAFEPNQMNVNVLLRNVEANDFSASFQLFPVALSDQPGILPMYGASTGASLVKGWAGQLTSTLVPISVFDETVAPLVSGKNCFVLIDIEGAELGCLKGATTLLASKMRNVFLIEISVNEHQPTGTIINPNLVATFELMFSYGFAAYTADSELREIELTEVKKIQASNVDTLGTHNFLFVKTGFPLSEIGL